MPFRFTLAVACFCGLTFGSLAPYAAAEERRPIRLLGDFDSSPNLWSIATSTTQTREKLRVELGKGFELTATQKHFVVGYPSGQKDFWTPRFEEIYNSFSRYFSVRGIKLREPSEPLVVIVFPTQRDFLRYAAADGAGAATNVLGYYSPSTNRVAMYDVGGGQQSDEAWAGNASTLIHELAHQLSFNMGLHNRRGVTPRWLVEGLGTLCEAPGIWKSRSSTAARERINTGRFREYQNFAKSIDTTNMLTQLIEGDRPFESLQSQSYAYSWALTYYLTETQPRKYAEYLQLTSQRPERTDYSRAERLRDFTKVFGQDLKLVSARFNRFMQEQQATLAK